MRYVQLGSSGLTVSRIALGMMSYGGGPTAQKWFLDEEAAEPVVRRAVEAGITFFDTADMYSSGLSEEITGRLLSRLFPRRDAYVLATKVFFPVGTDPDDRGLSPKRVRAAIDASLRRLGTDYVDLYQIHRWDYATPIEETMEVLHELVRSGKVRALGASSMYAWQFAKAQYVARAGGWTPFAAMQNYYNLLYREEEREMIPLCLDEHVGCIPWSPLARGMLTGTRRRDGAHLTLRSGNDEIARRLYEEPDFDVVEALHTVASARALPPARLALAWLLSKPAVAAPIIGATRASHIDDAVAAVELDLSEDEVARLEAPYRPHRVLGHRR
ncbi:aldo/keto reductase [Streptomyces sp. I05A-00742]|uniref:aldo/keto reductase n=1 Tax=Streptomyces sp. I05A-00742 TaxID=2732853 RepID=UPI0014889755|nr:aldo/keto reductase [Streptomyces sp. I05A-00742]